MQLGNDVDSTFADNVKVRHDTARARAHAPAAPAMDPQALQPIDDGVALSSQGPVNATPAAKPARGAVSRSAIQSLEPIDEGMSLVPSAPAPQGSDGGMLDGVWDEAKGFAGSAVEATGGAVRQAGKLLQAGSYLGAGITANPSMVMDENPLDPAADWVQARGKDISGTTSIARQLAKENSTPDGKLTDPSTWTLGSDPSVRGYIAQGTDVLGSMAPILLTGLVSGVSKAAAMAGVGGLVGGGGAIDQARETIANMDDDTLAKESRVYREAIADGRSPAEARQQASAAAENWASALTMPVSMAGGALLGKALSPTGRVLGTRGATAQTAGGALSTATVEGSQELGEGVATHVGINRGAGTEIDPLEGSFGNALLGAIGGAAPGTIHGAAHGLATRNLPVADSLQSDDITHNGQPFITLPAARKAAAEAGDGAQVFRLGNRFVVRKGQDAGSEFVDGLGQSSETSDDAGSDGESGAADQLGPRSKREERQRRAAAGISEERASRPAAQEPVEFSPGQQVFIHQNGRSMPVEFVGYESNAATANAGPERIARIKTADGRGRFVRVGDLVAEQPAAAPALPAPDDVTAAGDGFVARPTFNIPTNAPRGIRNNNPGNIEKGVGFQGEVEGNDSRFATFDSPESGIRGIARNLLTYQERHGLDTVEGIINRWAPKSENETGAYVKAVAQAAGVSPTESLNLRDPETIERLTAAIIQHENGMQPYPRELVQAGVQAALTGEPVRAGALPAPTISVDSAGRAATADQRNANPDPALGLSPDVEQAARNHPGRLEAAMHEAQTSPHNDLPEPTDAQKEAGNYKKGHVTIDGLEISIENPEGSVRSGTDEDGNAWSNTLKSHYGYIRRTVGADGDHVDTFIKPGAAPAADGQVFAIDQINPKTGKFDETKVMLGYGSQQEAEAAYKANYAPDWQGMGTVTPMDMPSFKAWITDGDTTRPAAGYQSQAGLGTIASSEANPATGSGFVMRSEAQKHADSIGGHVVKDGKRFRVSNEIPGADVRPPGGGQSPISTVVTPSGREVKVRHRVVEAGELIPSHTDTGQSNPRYPSSLQPRDRSRGASDVQVNDIAQNLRPAMLGVSATTSDGAPIISHRGVVESGNGRTLAIKRAYSNNPERAQAYRKWLQDQGYAVKGMKAPVLVRQRETEMSDADLRAYTRESNERTTAQMSATEQAQADAKSIAPVLGDYVGGDVASAANREFVRKFVRDVVSKADQGSMFSSDGVLSQAGRRRLEAALMAAAYDSPELVSDSFESGDSDIKSISGALLDVAGPWAQMRSDARAGGIPADLDTTAHLVEAVNLVRRARAEGKGIYDLANQNDILTGPVDPAITQFLRLFFGGEKFTRPRGRKPISEDLSAYVSLAQSTVPGDNMFGDSPPSGEQLLGTVNGRRQANENTGEQAGLFTGQADDAAGDEAGSREARRQGNAGVREPADARGQRSEVRAANSRPHESRAGSTPKLKGFAGEIQSMVDAVMAELPGAGGLQVRVVNRSAQVPENYRPSIHAEGVYYPAQGAGRVYLVADNLSSVDRARQVLAHEIVGHFGMEALLGDRFADVLADIERLTAIPSGVKLGIQRPGDKYYATLHAVKMDYPDYSPENQAREVLARMAETNVRPFFLERVYAYIRKFLRSLGLAGRYSAEEIKGMVVDAAQRLRTGTPEQSRAGALTAAESLRRAESRRQAKPVDLPDAIVGNPLGAAGKHPDYKAAKAGDTDAAIRLVGDLVSPDIIRQIRSAIGDQDVTIVPVASIEATGENRIPPVTAARIAEALGAQADDGGIYQSVKAKRSALGGLDRLFQQPEFEGPVQKGRAYFLVDDTLTQGGTFAALAQHIEAGGGRVVGSFALTGKQYSATLRLSSDTLNQVRERYGDIENQFREATGRGFDSLTESEGRYLAKHDAPDAVRDRIAAARHARRDGQGQASVPDPLDSDRQTPKAPPSEGLSDSGPMESRAATAGHIPPGAQSEPRYRGDVERPGESLSRAERAIRQSALGKIGAFSEVEPFKERAKKLTAGWPQKLQQGIFDQFAALKNLDVVAYMQARLSKGTDGAVEAVFRHGKVTLKDGALDVDSTGGLADVLAQLRGEHDFFFAWVAGNRAERLAAEGRENLFTPDDIRVLKNLNRGDKNFKDRAQVYAKALKEFNELQQSVMDVAEQAGLIDADGRKTWEHEFYVPFYRVMEEDQTGTMGPGQVNGLVGQRAFKKLKGGQEKLGDLLGNTLSNWSHLLSASMKNLAAQKALETAQEVGVAEKVRAAEKGSVRVMTKGKEVHYLVSDPMVLDSITALSHMDSSAPVMRAMRKFKHYLTTGVTLSPTFRLRNLARDSLSAMATTDISYNPVKNMADGWRGTSSQSPTYQRLLAGGGAVRFGSFNDGDQAANAKRLIERGVDADQILDSQSKVKRAFRGAFEWYQELGDRAETVNRAAIYEKAIADGKSHLEASYMARDLMDFTSGGSFASIRMLSQVVPFFNARLQGMYKLGRAAKDDPRRFATVTGAVAMASSLFYLLGKDDDEYKELPDWVRNTYWVTRMPGTGKFVYIPKPFEVGALGTVVERMTELMVAGDDYQAKDFADTLLHIMGDQLAMNPVPQLFKPVMGAAFNYDDFRGVNIDSMSQMRLPAGDRHTARTSAGAVAVGQSLNISPQRLEFMLRGYFGWLGTQALNAADFAARPFMDMPENPMRDSSRVDNWFVIGDFVKEAGGRSSKYVQRFYDQQREIEQVYAAYSEARKAGDVERAIELAGRDEIKLRPIYRAASKQLQTINRNIRAIDNDKTLDAATKVLRRDMLYQQRNRLVALADERARQSGR
ncbi:LPD38 domain-containing protein [Pusillimonas sp. SM2304]|uniref:LPD38 domain-containing protein n=1 Tax=Pusillimonas sp. SM2304 TaxID=3073241 RepID=UPI002877049C|nr:LPD38 domain-containing protein [Pusillimonas sp. SM2304]MDS1141698.1 LPD38 domain-containing protein [Pusillimonas sp. SM2304]